MERAFKAVRLGEPAQWLLFGVLALAVGLAVPSAPGDGWLLAASVVVLTVSVIGVLLYETDKLSPIALSAIAAFMSFAIGAVYYWYSPDWGTFALQRHPWSQHGLALGVAYGTAGWLALIAGYYTWPRQAFRGGLRIRDLSDAALAIMFAVG